MTLCRLAHADSNISALLPCRLAALFRCGEAAASAMQSEQSTTRLLPLLAPPPPAAAPLASSCAPCPAPHPVPTGCPMAWPFCLRLHPLPKTAACRRQLPRCRCCHRCLYLRRCRCRHRCHCRCCHHQQQRCHWRLMAPGPPCPDPPGMLGALAAQCTGRYLRTHSGPPLQCPAALKGHVDSVIGQIHHLVC